MEKEVDGIINFHVYCMGYNVIQSVFISFRLGQIINKLEQHSL